MKKHILTSLLIFVAVLPLWATTGSGEATNIATTLKDSLHQEVTISSRQLATSHKPTTAFPNNQLLFPNNQLANNSSLITNNQVFRTFPEFKNPNTGASISLVPAIANTTSSLYEEGLILTNGSTTSAGMSIDSVQYYIGKAQAVIKEIREFKKFIGFLDGTSLLELPVGMHTEIGGLAYDIGIASIKLKPHYAELEVYMQFTMPQNGKELTFMGKGIKFTKEGGIIGDATLELVGDYAINLSGGKSQIILKAGTFVTFDCSGFKKMALDADVKFSRDLLLPEDAQGNPKATGNVMSSFRSEITDWNNLVIELDIQTFQLPSLTGVSFNVKSAVFDFSDTRNAVGVVFPKDYQHPDIIAGVPNLWRGFYLRELSVTLPKQFEKKDTTVRTSFAAYDVLIDNMGFTGFLEGKALIRPDEGNMSGWAYSLDSIGIDLVANQLVSAGLIGKIVIPVSKEDKAFAYTAIINPGNEYLFNVTSADSLEFSMFKTAHVELFPASYLEIKVVDNKFLPKANLHGTMTIAAELSEGKKGIEIADIAFENLQIQSVAPYIQVGNFSFGSELLQQKMAAFPISINNIGLRTISDYEVALDFDLLLNLTGSKGGSFGANAGLSIIGEMPVGAPIQQWKYKTVQVHEIGIDIDGGAFKLQGNLIFYKQDAVYGDGFSGNIQAEFQPGLKVAAAAVFGNVDGYRYWYADALASLPQGLPIFTGVGIYGFGGGAYYRMAMDTDGNGSKIGQTASGVVYVPKENAGLGLKATIEIGSHPSPEAFNGDVTFEVAFFQGGGIRYISFKGNGYFATSPATGALAKIKEKTMKLASVISKLESTIPSGAVALLNQNAETDQSVTQIYGQIGEAAGEKGQISASVFISYDFENRILHGNFEAYINVAGGIIKGIGDGGRAGWAVLHFAPDEWYVYVGTPEDRMGIKMGVGPISASATSYLMVGTSIPGSPAPPENISRILGLDASELDYMRDLNALGNGAGFAFGANFGIDTGDLTFLMFYARFAAGAGFDIMLKNYGNAKCVDSSEPLGINGWYANGQAYAYFEGKIGIQVKLFGKKKKVEILQLQAAAILQAKLPNPFWMKGIVGGNFSVLGGLVKGNCKFEVIIGEECEIVKESVLEGIAVIAAVTPTLDTKDVDVFTTPQAVFNMPINQIFEMVDTDDIKKSFRIVLDEFKLTQAGAPISGNIAWNDTKDVAAFDSHEVFPSEKQMKVNVQISFEEKKSGTWTPVFDVDGKRIIEKRESAFTSGIAPDYIPLKNVAYSYPVVSQLNFYKNEYGSGYIKLKKGQAYLFKANTADWEQKGRFTSTTGTSSLFNYAYNAGNKQVNFALPNNIQTNTIYAFELVNLPVRQQAAIDRNVSNVTNKLPSEGTPIDMEFTTKKAEGTIDELQEKSIFIAYYKTSQFSSLKHKLAAADMSIHWRWAIRNGVHELAQSIKVQEYFDKAELDGTNNQPPLIQIEAVLANNKYYNKYMYPVVYAGYPLEGSFIINWRNGAKLGIPPAKAVFIRQYPQVPLSLTESHILSGQFTSSSLSADFIYNLSNYYQQDMSQLQNKVANYYVNTGNVSSRINLLLTTPFPVILKGKYEIMIKYIIPGKNITTSENKVIIINSVQ